MAKTDWDALFRQFCHEYSKHGTPPQVWCEANGLNYASARRYIKIPSDEVIAQSKARNDAHAARQALKMSVRRQPKVLSLPPEPKPPRVKKEKPPGPRGSRHNPPTNPFIKGQAVSLLHGAYSKRMLLPDDIIEDAKNITLEDELHRLRANNLIAAEAIGRYRAAMEDPDVDPVAVANFEIAILSANKGMSINTQRIESLVRTISILTAEQYAPLKMQADIGYRLAATEKVREEIEVIRAGDSGGKAPIVVHNMLPMLEQD